VGSEAYLKVLLGEEAAYVVLIECNCRLASTYDGRPLQMLGG